MCMGRVHVHQVRKPGKGIGPQLQPDVGCVDGNTRLADLLAFPNENLLILFLVILYAYIVYACISLDAFQHASKSYCLLRTYVIS